MLGIPTQDLPRLMPIKLGTSRKRKWNELLEMVSPTRTQALLSFHLLSTCEELRLPTHEDGLGGSPCAFLTQNRKRILLLGPSHHHYLTKAALSHCTQYATPLGNLLIDRNTTAELYQTGQFEWMSQTVDEEEHSLEMHLPYIYKTLANTFGSPSSFPPVTPILIGNTSAATEKRLGKLLAPYLADSTTAFVISSDFAHWGLRFRYTYYQPSPSGPVAQLPASTHLTASSRAPRHPPIHESIRAVDFECIAACEGGSHDAWLACLEANGNTVCGRHPIGVMMAAVEEVRASVGATGTGTFRFVRYERSSEVQHVSESSVSYASAFAVI
nr:protein memo1 [Quercus suber]